MQYQSNRFVTMDGVCNLEMRTWIDWTTIKTMSDCGKKNREKNMHMDGLSVVCNLRCIFFTQMVQFVHFIHNEKKLNCGFSSFCSRSKISIWNKKRAFFILKLLFANITGFKKTAKSQWNFRSKCCCQTNCRNRLWASFFRRVGRWWLKQIF